MPQDFMDYEDMDESAELAQRGPMDQFRRRDCRFERERAFRQGFRQGRMSCPRPGPRPRPF